MESVPYEQVQNYISLLFYGGSIKIQTNSYKITVCSEFVETLQGCLRGQGLSLSIKHVDTKHIYLRPVAIPVKITAKKADKSLFEVILRELCMNAYSGKSFHSAIAQGQTFRSNNTKITINVLFKVNLLKRCMNA